MESVWGGAFFSPPPSPPAPKPPKLPNDPLPNERLPKLPPFDLELLTGGSRVPRV